VINIRIKARYDYKETVVTNQSITISGSKTSIEKAWDEVDKTNFVDLNIFEEIFKFYHCKVIKKTSDTSDYEFRCVGDEILTK